MKKVFLLILLFSVTFISYGLVVNVDATTTTIPTKFKGNSYNGNVQFTRDYLSEQTNTIYFDSLVYETGYYDYASTGITVSSDEPMITVLTHGYGGAASHWSNNYEYISDSDIEAGTYSTDFIYDSDSLIERLRIASNADVYFADMQNDCSFYLYKIDYSKTVIDSSGNDTNLSMHEYEKTLRQKDKDNVAISSDEWEALIYTKYSNYVESISNISNHMIIVFEAYSSQQTNDYIYNQLDYMIDKIVYDVRCLNNGVLPKINLISHSRGGITNMQYALEHPALVESIITLGSPFLGSHLGQSEKILDFVGFSPTSPGIVDIQDATLYDYEYISLGSTGHKTTCSCGISKTESHVIKLSEIVNNRANCIYCGYLLNLNTDIGIVIQNNTHLESENGSYILANGTIVLVDEDVEAYEAGTLVFFDKNNESDVELS